MLKFIFLHLIREIYLFFRNLWGLVFHPYKTLASIRREEDLSQAFLVGSWPISVWLILAILFVAIKFLFRPIGVFNTALNAVFILYSLFFILYFLYLVYWLLFYLKVQRRVEQ